VVGGFRYAQGSRLVGSPLLGLYDADGRLDRVGFTYGIADSERAALTRRLEARIGSPGFSGRVPGGPSRWSSERSGEWEPLKPEFVVEVRYDHVTGGRFRHGAKLVRWRPDRAPRQCTLDQLKFEGAPELVRRIARVNDQRARSRRPPSDPPRQVLRFRAGHLASILTLRRTRWRLWRIGPATVVPPEAHGGLR
jgi:hypothetical protein